MNTKRKNDTVTIVGGHLDAALPPRPGGASRPGLVIRSAVRAGKIAINHNQRERRARGVTTRTTLKAGRLAGNHSAAQSRARGIGTRTSLRAGKIILNHSATLLRRGG